MRKSAVAVILGIDPGKTGGWTVLDETGALLRWGRSDKMHERDFPDTIADLTIQIDRKVQQT